MQRRTFLGLGLAGLLPAGLPATAAAPDWVEGTLARLDLDGRIAQLMMPMLEDQAEAEALVKRFRVGGFVCFKGRSDEFARRLAGLQTLSTLPLLMAADFERGAGAYVDGATELPTAMAIGAADDPDLAYAAGRVTAREARALGVHAVFAPVLDLNNNPKNPIINVRSFGEDPARVALLGGAFARGLEEHGTLATIKHFPGHGNVATDSHRDLGAVGGDRRTLEALELAPFRRVMATHPPRGLMAAHLWVRAFDPAPVPATLSPRVLSDLLRREMGYRGLVFTDSLGMGGVLNHVRDWPEAQVLALAAGCDVLVMPTGIATDGSRSHLLGVERGIAAIRQAVRRGRLSAARIEASTRRVLAAKAWLGLPGSTASDPATLDSAEHRAVAQRIARSALTLVQDRRGLLPLTPGKRLGIVRLTNREGDGAFGRDSDAFVSYFRSVDTVQWSAALPSAELGAALELAARVDVLLVAASLKVFVGDGSGDLSAEHRAALARLSAANPNLVFLSFGSPYALAAVRDLSTLVCAYDYSAPMQEAAARALFSREPWTGKLPVRI